MYPKDHIIVVGASAGGVESLITFVSSLPHDLPAAIFVVQHLSPNYVSALPQILSKNGSLPAGHPKDGEKIQAGRIYVASPDRHLLIEHDRVLVKKGPKENRFRPSIDALFRSAAYSYGPQVIGIVLSGALDDGTSGLWSIKRLNGTTIVQEPSEAAFDSMPFSALEQVEIDYCISVHEMGDLVSKLTKKPRKERTEDTTADREKMKIEISVGADGDAFRKGIMNVGSLTPFTCPECHGVLVQIEEGEISRYRCHTGHAYSRSSLLSEIMLKVDESYWSAMRSLEEATMLLDRMGRDMSERGHDASAALFFERGKTTEEHSRRLREMVLTGKLFSGDSVVLKAEER